MLVAAEGVATVDAAEAAPSSLTVRGRKTARRLAGIVAGGLALAHWIRFAFGVMVVAVAGAAVAFGRVGADIVDYYPFYVLFWCARAFVRELCLFGNQPENVDSQQWPRQLTAGLQTLQCLGRGIVSWILHGMRGPMSLPNGQFSSTSSDLEFKSNGMARDTASIVEVISFSS